MQGMREGHMKSRTTRVAPPLLATVVAILASGASLRAEPADAPAPKADACLEKPSGAAPAGQHWYYHVDRMSGRHCWYLHQRDAAADQKIRTEHAARSAPRSLAAPASHRSADAGGDAAYGAAGADQPAESSDNSFSSAPPAPSMPPAPSAAWPSAPPPASEPAPPPQTDNTAAAPSVPTPAADPAPAAEPKVNMTDVSPAEQPASTASSRPAAARESANSAIDPSHIPALLGTALVFALIVFGSVAFRIAGRVFGRPRSRATAERRPVDWDALFADAQLVPDITTMTPAQAPQLRAANEQERVETVERVAGPQDASAQLLNQEHSVRGLLRRLQSDLGPETRDAVRAPEPSPRAVDAPSLASNDLDEALALLRGIPAPASVRRGKAGGA